MAFVIADKKVLAIKTSTLTPNVLDRLNELYKTKLIRTVSAGELLILPHKQSVLNVLDTLGVNTEGCDLFSNYYEPPKCAWWWQLETAKFLTNNRYAFVTSTPRTGKTLSTLMAIDFIQQQSPSKSSALIVAPLTVAAGGEWEQSIRKFFPNKKYIVVHSNREVQIDIPADIYITNPDSVKILKDKLKAKVEKGLINLMVFDELTEFANTGSQRWKAANEVASKCKYRWGLTGTPGKPEKIYGQVKLINPERVPRYFSRWRAMTEVQVSQFLWIPKHGHEEIIKEAMSPCIRFDKEQLMKVPTPDVRTVKVPLSGQQAKIMKELVDEFRTVIEGEEVNVLNASTLAIKMLQVAGGAVRVGDEGESKVVNAEPKLNKLHELLLETPRKKVIFSSFVAVNDMLLNAIRCWGFSCEKIDGSITGRARARILEAFMNNKDPHILVCHPRTTAFGVELAAADMIICYGCPITGAFMYQQMFERISSSKQTATKTAVVHLSAGKQDAISFNALSNGVNIERNIVKLFTKNLDKISG